MRISIIIPVYNVADFILDCLNSVISQSYKEIECIIINDCSPDESMEHIERLLSGYKGTISFKIINHQKNKGLSAARNTGVHASTGEYLYFLDSDDRLMPKAIEQLVNCLKDKKVDIVLGNYSLEGLKNKFSRKPLQTGIISGNENIWKIFLRGGYYEMACNKLIEKNFFIENDLFFIEGLIHEDVIWNFMTLLWVESIYLLDVDTYIYYIREGSITTSDKERERLEALKEIIIRMYSYISVKGKMDNKNAMFFIEKLKMQIFPRAKSYLQEKELKVFYNNCIAYHIVENKINKFFFSTLNSKSFIINIHFLIPKSLGFYYYISLFKFINLSLIRKK